MWRTKTMVLALALMGVASAGAQCPPIERPTTGQPAPEKPGALPLPPWFEALRVASADVTSRWQPWFPDVAREVLERGSDVLPRPVAKTDIGDRVPYLVLIFDGSRSDHRRDLKRLRNAPRLRAAALLFDCLRLDARSLEQRPATVLLRVHTPVGALLASVDEPSPGRALSMIGVAARRLGVSRFDRALAKAERLASGITTEELSVRRLEARLVCPSCGQGHEDVARELKAARSRRDAGDLQLEQLRLQLWSRR